MSRLHALSKLFLIVPALLAFRAAGADFYVATTGSNSNDGSSANPVLTITYAISLASAGDTIHVEAGSYNEDVNVNKSLIISGAGASTTTVSGPIGGQTSTFLITASNVVVEEFYITRDGNNTTDWNNPGLNTMGVSIQGQGISGTIIRNCEFYGNRTAIDINNSNSHTIQGNFMHVNRQAIICRNQTDNLTVTGNEITDNFGTGILFLDASGGTNSPVQSASNCTFQGNNISGNWYADIVDRQSGGSLPSPGTNGKNFSGNWFGTATPVITTANSTEPGYAALIPTVFGGAATAPGGQPNIAGPASANFDITPLLTSGADISPSIGFQSDFLILKVVSNGLQTGATGRVSEALALVSVSGTVEVSSGTYTENVTVNNGVTLTGTGTINGSVTFPAGQVSKLDPGDIGIAGILSTGNLSFSSNTESLNIDLAGTTAGTGYDQVDVTGTVQLNGATLNLSLTLPPPDGTQFTIINNDGADAVTGTFDGLPEGGVIMVSGVAFKISYVGGTGNDVVLTVDLPPTLTPTGTALTYTENDGSVVVDSGITIVESNNIAGAIVGITNNFAAAEDSLSFTNTGTISGSYNAATGVLILSGTDSVANYQAALRSVRYTNSSENPSTATRTILFAANDGTSASPPATRDINVVSVNDAPVVTSIPSATPNPASVGETVSFTAAASDDTTGLTITWDFGDGTSDTSNSSSVTHAFSAPQSYTVTLTVRDAGALTATATIAITVNAAVVNPKVDPNDTDGDGYSNELELAAKSDPNNPNSIPPGLEPNPEPGGGATIDFFGGNERRVVLRGSIPGVKGLKPDRKSIVFDINGHISSFILNKKGRSPRDGGEMFAFQRVRHKELQSGRFTLTLRSLSLSSLPSQMDVKIRFRNKVYTVPVSVDQD